MSPVPRDGLKGLRNVVNEVDDLGSASARAAKSARDTRDSYASPSPQHYTDDDELSPMRGKVEPRFAEDDSDILDDAPQMRSLEPSYQTGDEDASFPPPGARTYREIKKITTKSLARRDPIAAGPNWPWW